MNGTSCHFCTLGAHKTSEVSPSEVDMFRQGLAVPELTDHGSKKGLKREGLQIKTMFLFAPNKWEARKSGGKNMFQQFN